MKLKLKIIVRNPIIRTPHEIHLEAEVSQELQNELDINMTAWNIERAINEGTSYRAHVSLEE